MRACVFYENVQHCEVPCDKANEAYQRGRDEERASVVAHFRKLAASYRGDEAYTWSMVYKIEADRIEKGEHEVKR